MPFNTAGRSPLAAAGALAAGAGAALPGGVWAWLQAANASMTGNNSNAGAVRREVDNMGTPYGGQFAQVQFTQAPVGIEKEGRRIGLHAQHG
ncbi:hypothetical protein G6F24_018625 [Rhizopus arrhizus]|nr:hypothetical protein G6F24_018625 [Rhizopus arrhizus]